MKFSDFTAGRFLSSREVAQPTKVTVWSFDQVEVEPGRVKVSCKFREFDKPMLLNKTNLRILQRAFGDDMDAAKGRQIVLFVDENVIDPKGQIVSGLRLRPLPKSSAPQPEVTSDGSDIPF